MSWGFLVLNVLFVYNWWDLNVRLTNYFVQHHYTMFVLNNCPCNVLFRYICEIFGEKIIQHLCFVLFHQMCQKLKKMGPPFWYNIRPHNCDPYVHCRIFPLTLLNTTSPHCTKLHCITRHGNAECLTLFLFNKRI